MRLLLATVLALGLLAVGCSKAEDPANRPAFGSAAGKPMKPVGPAGGGRPPNGPEQQKTATAD